MSVARHDAREPEPHERPRTRRPAEPVPHPLLALQRSAGNAAVGRLLQRLHSAFNEANYWRPSRPAVLDIPEQPHPLSPEGVLQRLRETFDERLAKALLHTDAAEEDAEPRIDITGEFIKGGGTTEKALELLNKHPLDNAALKVAYDRDKMIRDFLAEGGSVDEVNDAVAKHPEGVDGLRGALHRFRRTALGGKADAAFARLQKLHEVRLRMGWPQQPAHTLELRNAILAGSTASQTRAAKDRADLTSRINDLETWVALREPTVLNMSDDAIKLIWTSRISYKRELDPLMAALFYREPYDQGEVDKRLEHWNQQVPAKKEGMQSVQEMLAALARRIVTLWALADGPARTLANLIYTHRAQDTLKLLEDNHVPKATWDRLVGHLSFEQVVQAVAALRTPAQLLALAVRLDRRDLTGANLSTLIAAGELVIPRGRPFPYHGGHHGLEVETEMTANWRPDLWMPSGMARWADIHIHYNGRVALQANVRFVHVKDRTVPGVGTDITGHPLIAAAYGDGRLDPTWSV